MIQTDYRFDIANGVLDDVLMINNSENGCLTQVLIAALNEKEGIGRTISELNQYLDAPKVLVVDCKSIDGVAEVGQYFGAKIVYQRGIGKGIVITKGISHLNQTVHYVVIRDADNTYPDESIPEMILQENPSVGIVRGKRPSEKATLFF